MEIGELVRRLVQAGVRLEVRASTGGEELVARGEVGGITAEMAAGIREHRGELMEWAREVTWWRGRCAGCGTAVDGGGVRTGYSPPVGEVWCMECGGKRERGEKGKRGRGSR